MDLTARIGREPDALVPYCSGCGRLLTRCWERGAQHPLLPGLVSVKNPRCGRPDARPMLAKVWLKHYPQTIPVELVLATGVMGRG